MKDMKDALITQIVSESKGKFSDYYLRSKNTSQLKQLLGMVRKHMK